MSDLTQEAVLQALSKVLEPQSHKNLVELNMVDTLAVCDGNVKVDLILPSTAYPHKENLLHAAREAIEMMQGVNTVTVGISLKTPPAVKPFQRPASQPTATVAPQQALPGVKNVIAISSGKGGVGKTSVSVNLACTLAAMGLKVGIVDADAYGPNVGIMLGLRGRPPLQDDPETGKPIPPEKYGVKAVSAAMFMAEEAPMMLRGPMLNTLIKQFLFDFQWGELDFLLVDLPPGTGDAQLSTAQLTKVSGAVIVTTPQEVAIHDSRKGLEMFRHEQVNVPILGVIENMSYFECEHGGRYEIFGHGGGKKAAEQLNLPFLGEIPFIMEQRQKADQGEPIVVAHPDGPQAEIFRGIAKKVLESLRQLQVPASV